MTVPPWSKLAVRLIVPWARVLAVPGATTVVADHRASAPFRHGTWRRSIPGAWGRSRSRSRSVTRARALAQISARAANRLPVHPALALQVADLGIRCAGPYHVPVRVVPAGQGPLRRRFWRLPLRPDLSWRTSDQQDRETAVAGRTHHLHKFWQFWQFWLVCMSARVLFL